jgi:hypothetical protein
MVEDAEWTDADLALLQSLDAAGTDLALIARRLGRSEEATADKLPIARERLHPLPTPQAGPDEDNEWLGPDEEGDVELPSGRSDDDPSAWVHRARE